MRPIHWVQLDEIRPAVVLTREVAVRYLHSVTVAPITSTIRGLSIEVPVGPVHGLNVESVINCDNITTVRRGAIRDHIGYLSDSEDSALLYAIQEAFGLLPSPRRPPPAAPLPTD